MSTGLPLAERWWDLREEEPGVFIGFEPHVFRWSRANAILIKGTTHDIVVDTGCSIRSFREAIAHLIDKPLILFTTHCHRDHVGGHADFRDAEILVHAAEAEDLRNPPKSTLRFDRARPRSIAVWKAAGIDTNGYMIDALPYPGFDPETYSYEGVEPDRLVDEGDIVDIGSQRFEVLHLPGHSPGCIALWDAASGTLYSGDAIYDGIISDRSPYSDIPTYIRTMERLRTLPVRMVHGGHRGSFGRARLLEIVDDYLTTRRAELAR